MYGHRLMATPTYDSRNNKIAAMNDADSERLFRERHSQMATISVTNGTGDRNAMLGHENQRAAMSGDANGVQILTAPTPTSTARKHQRPALRAQACRSPSVFRINQPAPNKAYPKTSA